MKLALLAAISVIQAALSPSNPVGPPPPPAPSQPTVPVFAVNHCPQAVDFYLLTVNGGEEENYSPWLTSRPNEPSKLVVIAGVPLVHNPAYPLRLHKRPVNLQPQVRRTSTAPVPDGVAPGLGQHPLVVVPFPEAATEILVNLCADYEPAP